MPEEILVKKQVINSQPCPQCGAASNKMKAANMWRCVKLQHEFNAPFEI